MWAYLRLLRPHHWIKNFFIFLPLFFSLQITNLAYLERTVGAFIIFSMVASSIYIYNDLKDIEEDRKHPTKKLRPIASGVVSVPKAITLMVFLMGGGLALAYALQLRFFLAILVYLVMNMAYSSGLKHVALIDVFIIAFGFILRIYAGGVVINNALSMWIILLTFLLALFMALGKRRDDVVLAQNGAKTRKNISGYSLEFLNISTAVMASVILVCYIFYTISPEVTSRFHSPHLYFTVIFVLFGVLRFLQVSLVENKSSDPTIVILHDHLMQLTLLGWIGSFIVLAYL